MNKKAQITIFVVIAIVIVAGAILFFVFRDNLINQNNFSDVSNIQSYVDDCIKGSITESVYEIGQQGGYYEIPELSLFDMPYYYYEGEVFAIPHTRLIDELENSVESKISLCSSELNQEEGVFIDEVKSEIIYTENKMEFRIRYPIVIKRGDQTDYLEDFGSFEIKSQLFLIHDLAYEFAWNQLGMEGICLSCLHEIASKNDFEISLEDISINTTEIKIKDGSRINGDEFEFKFLIKLE